MQENDNFDDLTDQLKNYAITNFQLIKFQSIEKIVSLTPAVLSGTLISVIIYLGILFLSLELSIYLSFLLSSTYLGFVLVGVFYLVLGAVFIIARKKLIIKPIQNLMIKAIFKKENKAPNGTPHN